MSFKSSRPRFRKSLLALAAGSVLAPPTAWALDLTTAPPGTITPYVAPNVILSLDDSTSMNAKDMIGNTKTRTQVLKEALLDVFNDSVLLPDGKIRFAWQTMGNCTKVDGSAWAPALSATSGSNKNVMRVLEGGHRANFLKYMENYSACTNTPTHLMSQRADAYMRAGTNPNGPWASVPGSTGQPYLGCRRNYHILLTDGGWNSQYQATSPVNFDGTTKELPDGTDYDISSPQTRLYRDTENYTTLSDWAFRSWADRLQAPASLQGSPDPSNEYRDAPATETFTNKTSGSTATLNKFWNPRYNPATWPHMVTFTIGFSTDARPKYNFDASGNYKGAVTAPTTFLPYGYDGNLADYINGTYAWRAYGNVPTGSGTGTGSCCSGTSASGNRYDRSHDMWHAALNSRGQFYSVEKGEDLKKAFEAIIGAIKVETEPDTTSTAASGSNVSRNDVGKFTGNYEPKKAWKGFVTAETVLHDGSTTPTVTWGNKNTADKLDDLTDTQAISNRLILTWSDEWQGATGQPYKGGVSFKWSSDNTYLSAAQKAALGLAGGTPVATSGEAILNYIRGNRSQEGTTTTKPFRERTSRQGDIVNSSVWYAGAPASGYTRKGYTTFVRNNSAREPMIYVGGNDGMLHGFSATDGSEKIAYVPRGVIASLPALASSGYGHKYYVDGSPMTGDVDMSTGVQDSDDTGYDDTTHTPDWRTLLVGTLGAGGKGYFVLDVTNPGTNPNADGVPGFDEANAQQLVKLDRTRGATEASPDCAPLSGAEKDACQTAVAEDRDIGQITAQPVLDETNAMRTTQITRMNNNRWAVVLGNGYNSTNQRPVLLIQYLDGARELLRIPVVGTVIAPTTPGTGLAKDNGLSAPRLVDLNGDGRADVAYAGDNLGNMWKFDLTDYDADNWKVAFGGSPLFTATGPSSFGAGSRTNAQPITVAPTVLANDRLKTVPDGPSATKTEAVGGVMVAFGTGRNVSTTDPTDVLVQTLYSVLDNTRYEVKPVSSKGERLSVHPGDATKKIPTPTALGTGVAIAKLAERNITDMANGGRVDENDVLDMSTWANHNGWYMDLPATGERLLKNMDRYDNTNLLVVYSQVPAKGSDEDDANVESCSAVIPKDEVQYRTLINMMDGKRPSVQLVDANGDGVFNAADGGVSRIQVHKGSHNLIARSRNRMLDINSKSQKEELARMPEQALRPSWRQIK